MPRPLGLSQAIDALASPYAHEQYSHLTGEPLLVIDFTGASGVPVADASARALENLRELPCPSIGIGAARLPRETEAWARELDVLPEDDAQLRAVTASVLANPTASLALVQLTRHSESLSIHQALVAESLVYSTLQSGPEFAAWLSERKAASAPQPREEPAVRLLRDGARLHITLDRPDRRNAFCAEMRDALADALRVVGADATIEEVILRGAGPAFCGGGDLGEFGTLPDPATAHVIRSTRNPARLLSRCATRVRAELHGACVGAGIELPAFTSHVRAKRDAWFWLPEVSMGLVPGAGGTVSLPRRIGRQRTNLMALGQERIDAERGLRWGLVDELVD
ncbi:MAG: enoyl-CoA hydratase/isomerase family protein [bacterium]|nr:enoyl-CoA hydratase/isomerase family protein [bacterium]